MKITTKGKFAVTALLDIAIYSKNGTKPITLYAVSSRQNISLFYLEQLFVKLRKSDMVKSFKGPGGGYILARDLQKIKIAEIIKAVGENLDARTCHGSKNCNDNKQCLTHDLWHGLTNELYNYLNNISLNDLVIKSKQKIQEIILY